MSDQMIRLVTTPIPSTEAAVYQVPSASKAIMTQMMLCNTHTSPVTVNIALTDSTATSSSSTDRIFSAFSLSSNETLMIVTNTPLFAGDKIWANSSVDDVVNLSLLGTVTADADIVGLDTESELTLLVNDLIPSAEEVLYTVPTGDTANMVQIMLCNTHSSTDATVNISVTDSSATSTSAIDRIFNDFSIPANSTTMLMVNFPLADGDKLWGESSINDVVHFIASGTVTEGTI